MAVGGVEYGGTLWATLAPPPLPLPGTHPLGFPPAKVPIVVQGGGRSWVGSASYRSSRARHPCLAGSSLRKALRYGGDSLTVRGDSVLHAERADRRGLLTATGGLFTCGLPIVAG